MASIAEALAAALDHHAAGRLDEAEILYRRILDADPEQADAAFSLSLLLAARGAWAAALPLLRLTAVLRPGAAPVHGYLAAVLLPLGQASAALAVCRRALAGDPACAPAWGVLRHAALQAAGSRSGAARAVLCRLSLLLDPAWADALTTLAEGLADPAAALPPARRAARLAPTADRLAALAALLRQRAHHADAEAAAGAGLALDPARPDLWSLRAQAASALARRPAAAAGFGRALVLDPDQPLIRSALWAAERSLGRYAAYASHEGQDAFVHRRFFAGRRGGTFVDVGAYDGVTWSNTLVFERDLGWRGLCLEPAPGPFAALARNRQSLCLNLAAAERDGTAEFLEVVEGPLMMGGLAEALPAEQREAAARLGAVTRRVVVPVRRLDGLLREHGIGHVDLCTIDAEGAERRILEGLDPALVTVDVFILENAAADPGLRDLLRARGHEFAVRFAGGDEVHARVGLR